MSISRFTHDATAHVRDANSPNARTRRGPVIRTRDIAFVRMLAILALAFAVAGGIFATQILDPTVTLPLVSWNQRLVMAGSLFLVAVGFLVGTLLYQRRIILRVRLSPDGDYLHLTLPTIFGGHREEVLRVREIQSAHLHGGDVAGEDALNAPWLMLHIKDHRPLVLPLTGTADERRRLLAALQLKPVTDDELRHAS